jgi:membrane-bound lytic murein transglycosylase A
VPAPSPVPPTPAATEKARYEPVGVAQLPALADADLRAAWPALLHSCAVFRRAAAALREAWSAPCSAAEAARDANTQRAVLLRSFDFYRLLADNGGAGTERGRITGYYEPLLDGSRQRSAKFPVPLHRPPDDLLTIDLGALFPELKGQRVRGRIEKTDKGQRVVPYWSRGELNGGDRLRGSELLWVADPIEAFFLQVQGSGRVRLPDGSQVRLAYADTNGHPYRSIGRVLVERGELALEQASMQGIKAWARANPKRMQELLENNPSYVFFSERPVGDPGAGPLGAFNVPLTPGYSVAVDPRYLPLGAPVVLSTTHPGNGATLTRLVLAQDTGGAIKGPLRFDLFWGFGAEAGALAGRQNQEVSAWLLAPRGVTPQQLLEWATKP